MNWNASAVMGRFVRRNFLEGLIQKCNSLSILQKRFYPQPAKRFYNLVDVVRNDAENSYEIALDGRKLKTPKKAQLRIQNEKLAIAIAQEWSSQSQVIQPAFMHLTSLMNTTVDNPLHKSKLDLVNECLSHLSEDTILFRDLDPNLLQLQTDKWDPVINWFQSQFQVQIPIVRDGILPPEISASAVSSIRTALSTNSFGALQGLNFAAASLKSLILAMAIASDHLSIPKAVDYTRLETTFQTENWGNVEWAHDLEQEETLSRVSAGMLFYFLNNSQH